MKSSNGKLMIGKKTILSLGALAKHDDGKPDYLKRLAPCVLDLVFRALGLDELFAILKAFGMELKPQLYTRVSSLQDVTPALLAAFDAL